MCVKGVEMVEIFVQECEVVVKRTPQTITTSTLKQNEI